MLRILSPALKLNPSQTKCQQVASNGCVACQRQLRERSQLTDAACGRVGQGGLEGQTDRWAKGVATKCHFTKCVYILETPQTLATAKVLSNLADPLPPCLSNWAQWLLQCHCQSRVVDMCVCVCVPGADTMLKCARISHAWITGERCFFHMYTLHISVSTLI